MAQFSVNAQRFDPYKNFKFRVKWDGKYVAGVSKVGALKRIDRSGRASRGRRPEHQPQVAGPDQVRSDHARARRDPRHRVREVGQQGLELRIGAGRGSVAQGLPQGHHHRDVQRGRAAGDLPTRSIAAGCRSSRRSPISTPTPTRSPSRRSSSRTRAGNATTRSPNRLKRPSRNRRNNRTALDAHAERLGCRTRVGVGACARSATG